MVPKNEVREFFFESVAPVNEKTQGIIAPLAPEGSSRLEIQFNRRRVPRILYHRNQNGQPVLVDEHNRPETAEKHNLTFKIKVKAFKTLKANKLWMIENQMRRRNLTSVQPSSCKPSVR
jgi:hypothetical protein